MCSTARSAQFGSALISCCSFPYTVDTAGHPTPGPCRFWRVESKVAMRACCSAFELPVGNGAAMGGLLTMWPAATFAFRSYSEEGYKVSNAAARRWRVGPTAMNWSRGGGHEQGIRIGLPLGPVIPSQLLRRRKVVIRCAIHEWERACIPSSVGVHTGGDPKVGNESGVHVAASKRARVNRGADGGGSEDESRELHVACLVVLRMSVLRPRFICSGEGGARGVGGVCPK